MEEQKKLRVVAYTRVSSKKNEQKSSLESQQIYYEQYIKKHEDWEFCGIIGDTFTGTKLIRKNFQKLIQDCGVNLISEYSCEPIPNVKPKYDLIVVKNTNRLARTSTVESLISALKEKNVYIFFESINKSTKDINDKLAISMLLNFDEEYSSNLSFKMKLGYAQAIEYRQSLFGEAHWGYKRSGSKKEAKLEPKNQEYADIINKMYHMYHYEKMGFQRIATWIKKNTEFRSDEKNADGTYKYLSPTGIKFILLNSKNAGYLSCPIRKDEDFAKIGTIRRTMDNFKLIKADNITPCVSKELYDLVFNDIKNHPVGEKFRGRNRPYSKYGKYLVCQYCGCHLTRTLDGRNAMVYVCAERKKGGSKVCNLPIISEKYIDECINNYGLYFKKIIEDKKDYALYYLNLDKYNTIYNYFHSDNTKRIEELKKEISETNIDYENLLSSYKELNPKTFTRMSNSFEEKIEKLENELGKLENSTSDFMQEVEKINKTINEIKDLTVKDFYEEEEIINNLSSIVVSYGREEDSEVMSLEELKEMRFSQNNANLEITTNLENQLEGMAYRDEDWREFGMAEKQELDNMYTNILL